ncbi:hypothetical protein [Actinomadura sp. NPDC048394]|uniref:hypothetical protein n=1 Tax=Actinomadura sp. NPDC048394 TaxID=3158223 RepID=UPI0033D537BF
MPNWRDRYTASPLWVYALTTAFSLSAYFGVIALAAGESLRKSLDLALVGCVFAAMLTAVAGAGRGWERRVVGRRPREARVSMAAAFRTGELPDDPALHGPLLALIESRRAAWERTRRWWPAVLVLLPAVITAGL